MVLVGGLEHLDYFSIYWEYIFPTDFHIFQRDWNHQPVVDTGNSKNQIRQGISHWHGGRDIAHLYILYGDNI